MRYTADQREWVQLHGVQCWVIPGREIVTGTILNAGTANHDLVNDHGVNSAVRIERIFRYLSTHKPVSTHSIALQTSQGHRIVSEILATRPDLFEIFQGPKGRGQSNDTVLWRIRTGSDLSHVNPKMA